MKEILSLRNEFKITPLSLLNENNILTNTVFYHELRQKMLSTNCLKSTIPQYSKYLFNITDIHKYQNWSEQPFSENYDLGFPHHPYLVYYFNTYKRDVQFSVDSERNFEKSYLCLTNNFGTPVYSISLQIKI